MKDFTEAARGLTKNPLGIIGLFIVLVYGFACLVLSFGAPQLDHAERSPLIWFIVSFPVLILGVFFRLVTSHHQKLYAPSDYKDERHFLAAPFSDQRRAERLELEVLRVAEQEAAPPVSETLSAPSTKQATSESSQVEQLLKPPRPIPAIRSTYADAERLAFLELEREIGKPFKSMSKSLLMAVMKNLMVYSSPMMKLTLSK